MRKLDTVIIRTPDRTLPSTLSRYLDWPVQFCFSKLYCAAPCSICHRTTGNCCEIRSSLYSYRLIALVPAATPTGVCSNLLSTLVSIPSNNVQRLRPTPPSFRGPRHHKPISSLIIPLEDRSLGTPYILHFGAPVPDTGNTLARQALRKTKTIRRSVGTFGEGRKEIHRHHGFGIVPGTDELVGLVAPCRG